jgi:PAS domain S-box-containing protein
MAICTRAEDLLAAILSSTEDGLLSFTLEGIVQNWSRGAELLYGYREAEIVGQPLGQLLPPNGAPKFDGLLHAAIRGEFPQCENTERLRKDGSSVFLAVSRAPIRNEHGDIVGIVEIGKARAASSIETVSEEHLKEIIEQMPMVLWTTNLHLRVTSYAGTRNSPRRAEQPLFCGAAAGPRRIEVHQRPLGASGRDRALKRLSEVMKQQCRSIDLAAR